MAAKSPPRSSLQLSSAAPPPLPKQRVSTAASDSKSAASDYDSSLLSLILPSGDNVVRAYTEVNVLYIYSCMKRGVLYDQSGPQGTIDSNTTGFPLLHGVWKRGLQVCM